MKLILLQIASLILFACTSSGLAPAQQNKRSFTVADEIGLTLFGGPNGEAPEIQFSPDDKYFVVWTERGDIDSNLVVDSLRFYRTQDVQNSLKHANASQPPSPLWVLSLSGKEGPIITDWKWLADSSGIGFLEAEGYYKNKRLTFVDLRKRKIESLTSNTQAVEAFDVVDRRHYVYTVADPPQTQNINGEPQTPAFVAAGRSIFELLFPGDPAYRTWPDRGKSFWAVIDGKPFEVKHDHASVMPQGTLVLSPDGSSLVTTLPVAEVAPSWETLYPPPYQSFLQPIRAGRGKSVHQYVLIDLKSGLIRTLTNAPISNDAGWWVYGADPSWSKDGTEIILPGTFLKSKENAPSRPCIAVVELPSLTSTCVETMKGHTDNGGHEEGYHGIHSAHFSSADNQRITVNFHNAEDFSFRGTAEYQRGADGTWQLVGERQIEHSAEIERLKVTVDQAFNKPPLLVAASKQRSLVLWDPNPQLKQIDLGQASTYKWDDTEGHHWRAGLFKPSNYEAGHRYPLVIQTHGFAENEFRPSGVFPTAFAARALAGSGMVVLQLEDSCPMAVLSEGPCVASGYETAARQLVSKGLVDPERIGIIGFSRTCYYVMQMLAFGSLPIKAALVTDGMMGGYVEYVFASAGSGLPNELDLMIGAPPFSEGLQQWLKRSPPFNLEKIKSPLLLVAEGPFSLLFMWQPYAGLRYLKKPVDLIMLNTREHVLTNPAMRLASQGGSVDWFRFWLQDYEDPDPANAIQYKRWRDLRKLQRDNEKTFNTPRGASN